MKKEEKILEKQQRNEKMKKYGEWEMTREWKAVAKTRYKKQEQGEKRD